MTLKEKINAQEENFLADLARLVSFNSVRKDPLPGKPFGEATAQVLAEGLKIFEEHGFETVNLDNYCGYAQMGEGEDIIGIAGHLDIVPAGDGWSTDPFTMVRDGDKIIGRGVMDDKGPVLAALYAMKIVRDSGRPINKRVRLIVGTAEETGSECMKHYAQVEGPVTLGFTPDGMFPGIYGEKGHMSLLVTSKNTKILDVQGGFVSNAVCHKCTVVVPASEVDADALKKELAKTPLKGFTVQEEDGKITITAEGAAAHASTPTKGINAASYTMQALAAAGFKDDFVDFYNDRIGTSCDGAGCGVKFADDWGALTFNNGLINMKDGVITCTIDSRVPVTLTEDKLRAAIAPYLEDERGKITIESIGKPLFYPKDSALVTALAGAYSQVTGDTEHEPMVIGGGTYAKALPGIIAFGAARLGQDYRAHNSDEWGSVSELLEDIEIFVKAIENLLDA